METTGSAYGCERARGYQIWCVAVKRTRSRMTMGGVDLGPDQPLRVRTKPNLCTPQPLGARELGTRVGLHLNTVRSHLRVLAEAGLASARREERTRPGRPRVLYEATAEALDAPALASYRLLAQILASSLAGSERDPSARAEEAGRAWGAHLVPQAATVLRRPRGRRRSTRWLVSTSSSV
jgi:DNA-binding transcriptional ArsR family regulator